MRDSEGFLLVFDVCHRSTLQELDETFMTQIKRTKDTEPFNIVFCANKSDIPLEKRGEHQVDFEEVDKIVKVCLFDFKD
jgi:GTPase SAR1 family protein